VIIKEAMVRILNMSPDAIWIVTQKFYFSRDLEKLTILARQVYLTDVV
jgi:hypothetical protein